MYARIQRFNLPQGRIDVAESLADQVAALLRTQRGFVSLTLLSDDSSGEYVFVTQWDALDDIGVFEHSREEWRLRELLSPHITAVPQIEVYQIHNLPVAPQAVATPAVSARSLD